MRRAKLKAEALKARFNEARFVTDVLAIVDMVSSAKLSKRGVSGLATIIGRAIKGELSSAAVSSVVERYSTVESRIFALLDLSKNAAGLHAEPEGGAA